MAEIDLSIFSMNCNGLNVDLKRIAAFAKLKKKTSGILLLQETHSTPEMEQRWQTDWGNKQMYFSHGASNSKGVAIIITNNYDANIVNIRRDTNGRMILLDIERNGTIYTVGNIYPPTRNFEQDQRLAFREFINYLEQMQNEHIVLGGDYNLCMTARLDKLDTMPEHNDNQNYCEDITSFLEINNLVDVCRTLHPDEKFFLHGIVVINEPDSIIFSVLIIC